ncbi:MAG: ABC transporter ATP-binding protein [Thermodesulfobacteriota bacterium]|jgi:branched-chain amino acid transport system ATP-binding protein
MLEVEKLNVFYGIVQVVYDASFEVRQGECVALLGANGAGKTTMLDTISGLHRAKSGSITFQGQRIENLPSNKIVKAGIKQVPEGRRVFPYLTVVENLYMGASGRREAWKKRHETLERVFTMFPILMARGNLNPGKLSGGEQQMLVIGRSMMAIPHLLMIDEPSLGLAPKTIAEIYEIIGSLHREGVTILLAEQNIEQALELANRGYVMENGRVVMEGPSEQLLESGRMKEAYLGM